MSNKIKLKRSSNPSSVPQLVDLSLGELAVNTFDGKIFFKKDDGSESIGSIVTTNAQITGSIELIGDVTASSFSGSNAELNSLLVTDFIELTGSLNITGSTTQIGNNNLIGNTQLSGSIIISGSDSTVNPSVRIFGNTQLDGVIRFDPVSTTIDTSISASYIYVSGSTDDLHFSQNGRGYSNVTRLRWLEGNINTGILWGGIVSGSVGGTTIDVSEGEGIITTMNAFTGSEGPNPTINRVVWSDFSDVSLTYLTSDPTTWLLIDSNGDLVQQTTAPTAAQFETHIQIGVVIHPNQTTISLVKTFAQTSYASTRQTFQFIRAFGGIKVSGHIIGDNGANLQLSRTSGTAFALGRNYAFNPNDPSKMDDPASTAPNIFYYYKESGEFVTTTGTSVINPNQYNEDGDGLTTVGNNRWTIQRIFFFPKSPNDIGVYYGRQEYSTLADAQTNLQFEDFDEIDNTRQQAIFLGYLIVEKGTTALNNTNVARFYQAGAFRTTGTGGGGGAPVVTNLEDLNDVAIASLTAGDLLRWEGAEWQNTVTDINITGSLFGNASTANTASYVTPLIQNVQITGSLNLTGSVYTSNAVTSSLFLINNDSPSSDIFLVKVGGNPKIKINQQGTFVINESATLPTPETGAIVVSGSNFFVYL